MNTIGLQLRVLTAGLLIVGLAACGSTGASETTSPGQTASAAAAQPAPMSRSDVVSRLLPLTKAVVAYTDTDYTGGGTVDLTSPDILSAAQSKFDAIQAEYEKWTAFTSTIDYTTVDAPGLQDAISDYDAGLRAWQQSQRTGLAGWQTCLDDGGRSVDVAACLMLIHPMSEEQAALEAYTTPLKNLLSVLGVETNQ